MDTPLLRLIETKAHPDNDTAGAVGGRPLRFNETWPLGSGWFDILMRISGSFRVSAVSDNAGVIDQENPASLLSNILINTGVDDDILNINGADLYLLNAVRKSRYPFRQQVEAGALMGNGTYPFEIELDIPFVDHRLFRGADLIMDTDRYKALEMVLTMEIGRASCRERV